MGIQRRTDGKEYQITKEIQTEEVFDGLKTIKNGGAEAPAFGVLEGARRIGSETITAR